MYRHQMNCPFYQCENRFSPLRAQKKKFFFEVIVIIISALIRHTIKADDSSQSDVHSFFSSIHKNNVVFAWIFLVYFPVAALKMDFLFFFLFCIIYWLFFSLRPFINKRAWKTAYGLCVCQFYVFRYNYDDLYEKSYLFVYSMCIC